MSEILRPRPVLARAAAPIAALSLLASGCTEPQQEATPSTWTLEVPEVPVTEAPNECEINNPEIARFRTSELIEADFSEGGGEVYANSELTEEQAGRFIQDLKTEYGINLTFPEASEGEGVYDFGSINDTPEAAKQAKDIAILSVVKAVRSFSPELIKALKLQEVAYVDGITRSDRYGDTGIDEAGGLYNEQTNTIYIDVARFFDSELFGDSSTTVVHELSHALDTQLLCGPDSGTIDREFVEFNSVFYEGYNGYEDNPEDLDEKYYKPSASRVFAARYGSATVKEDRATIIEWTFMDRGLILEGDPDYDSPLAKKQTVLVRRLEQLVPGISAYLQEHTLRLRAGIATGDYETEMTENMESTLFPEEFLSIEDALSRAREQNKPIEVLTNAIVEIDHPFLELPSIVVNPVVLRDHSGLIRGLAWTDGHSLRTSYFDQARMRLRYQGNELESVSGTMELKFEGNPESEHFFKPSYIAVKGVSATNDYAENAADLQQFAQDYPNVYDPLSQEVLSTTSTTGGLNIPTTTSTTR